MPKLSIIVPVYNAENYLDECIKSIINQTIRDIEILLIDDGSSDKSLSVCQKYEKIDSRIHVISHENSGAGKTRDLGVWSCKGDYIGFVDADDWVDNDMFESMYNTAIKNNVDVVRCNTKLHRNGKIEERWNPPYCNKVLNREDIEKKIIPLLIAPEKEKNYDHRLLRGCVCAIYKRDIIINNNIHFTDLKSGEDVLFAIDVMLKSNGMVILPNPYYHYMFYNNDSLSKSASSITSSQRSELRRQMVKRLEHTSGYEIIVDRWKQEDRRLVYLDVRIISVYAGINSRKERIKQLRNLLNDDAARNAFKDKIDKKLPIQMYALYMLIKYRMALILDFAVRVKVKG